MYPYPSNNPNQESSNSPFKFEGDDASSGLRSISYSNATYTHVLLPTVNGGTPTSQQVKGQRGQQPSRKFGENYKFSEDYGSQFALLNILYNKLGIEHQPNDNSSYRHELFLSFDLDRNGYITRAEFKKVLQDKLRILQRQNSSM